MPENLKKMNQYISDISTWLKFDKIPWVIAGPCSAESEEQVDTAGLKDKRIGRYGIKVETASSSPTARYANFMSILEVAGMYPGQVPVEAVI